MYKNEMCMTRTLADIIHRQIAVVCKKIPVD
jgi:hypothetical protein